MENTLYGLLQEATERSETDNGTFEGLRQLAEGILSAGPRMELAEAREDARKRELKCAKKMIIGRFADNRQSVADVVDGNATFYSYGGPIIEQAKRVEERYSSRKFALIPKGAFLGTDRTFSTSDDTREAVQYLKEENVINPDGFFSSRLILPSSARKVFDKMMWCPVEGIVGTGFLALAAGGYLGYLAGDIGGAIAGGLGGYFLGASPLFLHDLKNASLDRVSKQRTRFEEALKSLDSEVREYFPLNENKRRIE